MKQLQTLLNKHKAALLGLLAAGLCLVLALLIWLAMVRPNLGKSLAYKVSDDYSAAGQALEEGQSASQTFTFSEDLVAMLFVFSVEGEQPTGDLELTLSDADTGEVLAVSTGNMANIVPGQYTGLGLDHTVYGETDRHYKVTLAPRYTGGGRLGVSHSAGTVLWNETMTVNGGAVDGTMALQITYRTIGGFLTRFFLLAALGAAAVLGFGVWAALSGKLALHRLVFALVVCFGLLYSFVLPPYAAPDEKYHINQSFTLACRWANALSADEWQMGRVPLDTTYRREHDVNTLLQNERTTVFTWQELAGNLFTTTTDSFDSHVELAELQTEPHSLYYLLTGGVVFLCYLLHLGFVPALMLGRLANLLLFAALAAWAVRRAPFAGRLFAAAALLPMTLHLAVSFSRDAPLLGLCFAFTAAVLSAVFGASDRLSRRELAALAALGLLIAPGKAVYLPLVFLVLLIPAERLGSRAALKKAGYLAACVVLCLAMNGSVLQSAVQPTAETAAAEDRTDLHSQPLPGDTEYEATLQANTLENFVRRLYYYAEDNADPIQSEVDHWELALKEGDVSAFRMVEAFFFTEAEMTDSRFTDEEFLRRISLCMLGYDLYDSPGELNDYLDFMAGQDRFNLAKELRSHPAFEQRCAELGVTVFIDQGYDYDFLPVDRAALAAEVEAARATRETQSTVAEEDLVRYTPGYILTHIPDTILLVVRSLVENTDHYLRTLVGGSLSYYTLDIAWGWVLLLYLVLLPAALPAADEARPLPRGRARLWCALAALSCCALAVLGCITWTPVSHTTIYGLQGRYFLPVLPLLLLSCLPRKLTVPRTADADAQVLCSLCAANAGVLINAMLGIIAR